MNEEIQLVIHFIKYKVAKFIDKGKKTTASKLQMLLSAVNENNKHGIEPDFASVEKKITCSVKDFLP